MKGAVFRFLVHAVAPPPLQTRENCRGAILIALILLLTLQPAFASNVRLREQDGIVAQLDLEGPQAVVGWRFAHRPPGLVGKVEARVNGRPVGTPSGLEAFPGPGDSLLVTFLIDDGGLERALAIDEANRSVLDTIKAMPRFVQSRVGSYDTAFRRIDLRGQGSAAIALRAAAGPKDAPSDLALALRGAILAAAVEPATRRAIYVYTDGYSAGSKALDDIAAQAQSAGVSVSFVLTPSLRLADLALLERFATATGGRLLTRPGFVRDDILVFQASGARVRFPLADAHHFLWERTATLDVSLAYGDATLALSSDVETSLAGPGETVLYLWQNEPRAVVAAAAALVIVGIGLAIGLRRGRRRKWSLDAPRSSR